MANTYTTLDGLFTAMSNAIRTKKNNTEAIVADNFPTEIRNLTGFNYNNSMVTSIADNEFKNCEDLLSVDCIGITSVGANAFEGCENMKSVVLYDGVTEVGENTFKGCSEDLVIYCYFESQPETWHENWNPDNKQVVWLKAVETWNISATEEDNVIAKLYHDVINNIKYKLIISGTGNMNDYTNYKDIPWYNYYTNITNIVIKDGITNIGENAFYNCTSLTSITIPDSVTNIGDWAFSRCTGLTSITIPNSVTSIGSYTFQDCSRLTSITIPDSVTSIGRYGYNTFARCTNLTSVTIPDSVIVIGDGIFASCNKLININVDNNNMMFKSIDGNLYTKDGFKLMQYACGKTDKTFTIPDGVTSIGGRAFWGCTNLTSITIPDGVTSIGIRAFYDCNRLTSITIPDGVTRINSSIFYDCNRLTSITIPNSVTSIGKESFYCCYNLKSIIYTGTTSQWNAITFETNWDRSTGNYTIHCTDGDITKDGTITYHESNTEEGDA